MAPLLQLTALASPLSGNEGLGHLEAEGFPDRHEAGYVGDVGACVGIVNDNERYGAAEGC
jgi:hypothetical protein